ncbi:MAG: DNA topoisomerase I [Nitrospirae bacterium GWC2_57_13]|nr:MAG: DNA topoisomerase I [Nitrospirae bacterium GWC2_57_13]HAR45846.1 type I DNA topoisomerase [Nitrospiraceae bacterium]
MKSLIIVESPAKAKTIAKYLGKDFVVKASVGHVMDLPKSKLGVDVEKDFEPRYIVIKGKAPVVKELKAAAKKADRVLIATDPDREGEAIAAHVAEVVTPSVKSGEVYRVLFNEITKKAVLQAIEHPGKIDSNKVYAQQARRILDRLVGYLISPILWKKVRRGLSAGRVQSVALRIICEREEEIKAFVPEEFWSLTARLEGAKPPEFDAKLLKKDEDKLKVKSGDEIKQILADLEGASYKVSRVEKKERRRNPVPPFTTSKLQQEAGRKLGFTAKRTMGIAQGLYEGVDIGKEGTVGLITYMRTDSTRVGKESQDEARALIAEKYGKEYVPAEPPVYKSAKSAQEAHEAVRPTSAMREPDQMKQYLQNDQFKLYRLIWNRFMASQMTPAVIDQTSVDVAAKGYTFRATGSVVKFPGFMAIYMEEKSEDQVADDENGEAVLPPLTEGESLTLRRLDPKQHFTQPPPRFSEALLVKTLEEKGIGRPSTYAAIISTIQDRDYVNKLENKFRPTELGVLINDLLVNHFPVVMDVAFTARMEEELDKIEEGQIPWVAAVKEFYAPFSESLEKAQAEMKDFKAEQTPTNINCEKCGKPMIIKWGRNGQFLACSGYPDCKNTKPFVRTENGEVEAAPEETTDEKCPKCGSPMVVKRGKFGKFLACSRYPECKHTQGMSTGVPCPEDGGMLVERRSRFGKMFYSCANYPGCKYATWYKPLPRACPQCKAPFLVEKYSKKTGPYVACLNKECGYKEEPQAEAVEQKAESGEQRADGTKVGS